MMLQVFGVPGIAEVRHGDDIPGHLAGALREMGESLHDSDIVVVAQKIVSKAEGRTRDLRDVHPGEHARALAVRNHGDARLYQCVLDESVRVVREERVLIVETRHGYVCANGGVDRSNVPGESMVTLLPLDCNASAQGIVGALRARTGVAHLGVIVSDSFGRPFRVGVQEVALGVAGMAAVVDLRGTRDDFGHALTATVVAVADEIAGAAALVMGKSERVPVAVVRGLQLTADGSGNELLRPAHEDLFR